MSLYGDHVLPRLIDVACNMKSTPRCASCGACSSPAGHGTSSSTASRPKPIGAHSLGVARG